MTIKFYKPTILEETKLDLATLRIQKFPIKVIANNR
jgi:hypothetical protein